MLFRGYFGLRSLRPAFVAVIVLFAVYLVLSRTLHPPRSVQPIDLNPGKKSLQDVTALCQAYGYKPYKKQLQGRPRKVYDMFLISTELDWLEIRLNTLAPYVDHFVIVEAPTTFTGLAKPLYLQDHWSNFTTFHRKIIHRVVEDPGAIVGPRAWDHEDFLRNSLMTHVFPGLDDSQAPRHGDVLIVSDIDEVVRPDTLQILRHCDFPARLTLRSAFYYYSFQWQHRGEQWAHPQATQYRGAATIKPQDLRISSGGPGWWLFGKWQRWRQKGELWNAAWHCSSCFATLAEMQAKMHGFSHSSWATPENTNPETIVQRVRNGLDLFGRQGENYDRVVDNLDVPQYVLEHDSKFRYMLDRDKEDAAFLDYYQSTA